MKDFWKPVEKCVVVTGENPQYARQGNSLKKTSPSFIQTKNKYYKKQPQGCDSGFGLAIAERLASKGHQVFAGCLTYEGRVFSP